MKLICFWLFTPLFFFAQLSSLLASEFVNIRWNGNYPHNNEKVWSKEYRLGWSKNFMNGTPEEGGVVRRDGFLRAEIFKPKSDGPHPFVILLHGCGGYDRIARAWSSEYAAALNEAGYGALAVDSFSTRNVKESCGPPDGHWGRRRSEDAYSALDYLIENGLANKDQIYLIGRSNGGLAVLMAIERIMAVNHPNKFSGGFALVPACSDKKSAKFYAPLITFVAGDDDANPPHHCIEMGQLKRDEPPPLEVIVYEDAKHGYMDHVPDHTFHGWRMGFSKKAAMDTKATILQVLQNHMRKIENGVVFK